MNVLVSTAQCQYASSPRHHPNVNPTGAGALQQAGAFVQRGAGGHYIVNQRDMGALGKLQADAERAPHVAATAAGREFGLRCGGAPAAQ
jgi:hypothetical protein